MKNDMLAIKKVLSIGDLVWIIAGDGRLMSGAVTKIDDEGVYVKNTFLSVVLYRKRWFLSKLSAHERGKELIV